jgi:hypothetical protein
MEQYLYSFFSWLGVVVLACLYWVLFGLCVTAGGMLATAAIDRLFGTKLMPAFRAWTAWVNLHYTRVVREMTSAPVAVASSDATQTPAASTVNVDSVAISETLPAASQAAVAPTTAPTTAPAQGVTEVIQKTARRIISGGEVTVQ